MRAVIDFLQVQRTDLPLIVGATNLFAGQPNLAFYITRAAELLAC